MNDIYIEIKKILLENGISMSKLIKKMQAAGHKVPSQGNLSNTFHKKNVKFRIVQEILDFLGYKITIEKK